ncbi:MAG: transglutaminase family protein [Desulfobacterales bacterium]|nr:transglutaminase family protein [Desulfobacterales bacterium]
MLTTVAEQTLDEFLKPTFFIDSDAESIIEYASRACDGAKSEKEKAINLFNAVRDDISYDLFGLEINPNYMKASYILEKGSGYCVSKALVLAACARVIGIPCRLGFADVINHLNPPKMQEFMLTNVFAFHGFAELLLDGKWVKATPSFDSRLCEKSGYIKPEFDGVNDTVYPAFNKAGERHMEYISYYGSFSDIPLVDLMDSVYKYYPHFCDESITLESLFINADLDYEAIVANNEITHFPYTR